PSAKPVAFFVGHESRAQSRISQRTAARRTRRKSEAEISMKGRGTVKQRGNRRGRKAVLKAKRPGLPMVVAVKVRAARKIIVFLFMVWGSLASATTYYVSSSAGNDANSGTSSAAAWQTIGKVNGQT